MEQIRLGEQVEVDKPKARTGHVRHSVPSRRIENLKRPASYGRSFSIFPTMSSLALSAAINAYRILLEPIAPFTWFGLGISTLDVAGGFRLCLVLRQLRELGLQGHLKTRSRGSNTDAKEGDDIETMSYAKSIAVTLAVVYGGEAIMSALKRHICSNETHSNIFN